MSKEKFDLVRKSGIAFEDAEVEYKCAMKAYLRDLVNERGNGKELIFEDAFEEYDVEDLDIAFNEEESWYVDGIKVEDSGVVSLIFDCHDTEWDDFPLWARTDFIMALGEYLGDNE